MALKGAVCVFILCFLGLGSVLMGMSVTHGRTSLAVQITSAEKLVFTA